MNCVGRAARKRAVAVAASPCRGFALSPGGCWTARSPPSGRFQGPLPEAWTPEQRRIGEEITRSRSTGIRGPFGPWLANPALADPAQQLGRVCRYETTLDLRRSELVILMTAAHHRSRTEWVIHEQEALRAGLEKDIIAAFREGHAPNLSDPTDAALFAFTAELLETSKVCDDTYAELQRQIGDQGVVEVVGICGYYGLVALTLNVFGVEP